MWPVLVNLLIISYSSTQPLFDNDGRPIECCPCPKSADMATLATNTFARPNFVDDCPCHSRVPFPNSEGDFERLRDADQALAGTAGDGKIMRAGSVDDCPCRFRDADSVGAPSVFLPAAVRALWPVVSDKNTKEDVKPLLHPEVGLASSVLETLRQATDEEYQEALARDAVKSVLQEPDVDVITDVSSALDKARDIVNVLLKPNETDNESDDDNDSEATHVQESRCIHPLGRSKDFNLKFSPQLVNGVFTKPKKAPMTLFHKNSNIWDMDSNVGASNVHEQINDGAGVNFEELKVNSNPSLLNLFPGKSNGEPIQKINLKPLKINQDKLTDINADKFSLDEFNRKINDSLTDLKQKLDNHLQTMKNDNANKLKNVLDSVYSPSVNSFALKPLVPTTKLDITTIKPFPLSSLLKLKDVELIPPVKTSTNDFNRARVNTPKLIAKDNSQKSTKDIFKNFKTRDLGDLISNGLKISFMNKNNGGTDNIQPIPKKIFNFGILDAETSPSELKFNTEEKGNENCDNMTNKNSLNKDNPVQIPIHESTKILENLPNPTKLSKHNINNKPFTTEENQNESIDNNVNDLPKTVNGIPNTEIIDTVPSPSQEAPVELSTEDTATQQEDFSETLHDDLKVDCGRIVTNEREENTLLNGSDESNRDDENDDDIKNDEENIDEINIPNDSDSEESIIQEDSKSAETNDLPNIDETENEQCDSEPSTSNISPNVVDVENAQRTDLNSSEFDDENDDSCAENRKIGLESKPNISNIDLKNRFNKKYIQQKSLKENILRKLDQLNKYKNDLIMDENTPEEDECHNDGRTVIESQRSENKPSKNVDMMDLKNMSDKLLDLSLKREEELKASEKSKCSDVDIVSNESSGTVVSDDFSVSSEDITKNIHNNERTEDQEITGETDTKTENTEGSDQSENNFSCTSEFNKKSDLDLKSSINEMTADGSNPFGEKVEPESEYKPSLLRNILHPKDLNSGVIGLKLNLDDARENLLNIFEPKNNVGYFNSKQESLSDNYDTMTVDASTPTFKSTLPGIQPLEDINFDIFQLRPLKLPSPQDLLSRVPSLPQLNLNSYRAKLAVPKGLNLKPMKLESSLGGKNGLLGATLTVGSDKGPFAKSSRLFSNPLDLTNFPTLEELHSNMRESAQNLLLTPIDITGRNMIDDSLRSSQTLTDNIRSHAKNTMKDIKQTLDTTLKDVKESDLGILADPLKDPNEFLQAVSRTHEDVTDKLKAIHYDFNDRLESIRDRITDQSLLPTLNLPLMRQSSWTFGPEKLKVYPKLLSTTYSKPEKKLKPTGKSKPQSNLRLSSTRKKPIKSKTIKMPAASSIPVPKTVNAPKLKTIASSSPPPFLLRNPSLRTSSSLSDKKTITDFLQKPVSHFRNSKIPVIGRFNPTGSKVKISFGSTTIKPDLSRNKPALASKPTLPSRPSVSRKPVSHRISSKFRPFDANEAPSEIVPVKLEAPVTNKEIKNDRPVLKTKPNSKSSLNKSRLQNVDNKFTNGHSARQFLPLEKSVTGSQDENLENPKILGAPKNLDILASLREAVRARLSNITPLTNDKIVQPIGIQTDMLRSASENIKSTDSSGLMKENASYTCKMICTRNN